MQSLKPLVSKDLKELKRMLKAQYDFSGDLDYYWFKNEKQKLFIIDRSFAEIDLKGVRINSVGLYFGQLKDGILRLSVEGSRIVGPESTQTIELNEDQLQQWLNGDAVDLIDEQKSKEGFLIIQHGEDFLGAGKMYADKTKLQNYYPKSRRIHTIQ